MRGISITIIGLIIGVIILVILVPLLFKAASNVWSQFTETLEIVKYSQIERALICYYYLCTYGCKNRIFTNFCGPDKIGNEAYEEVCNLPNALGVDGEQCRSAYFQFPIKVRLSDENELSMEKLKKRIEKNFVVIWEEGTTSVNPLVSSDFTYIKISPAHLKDKEYWSYSQSLPPLVIKNAIKFANVKPNNYNVIGNISEDGFIQLYVDQLFTYISFRSKGESYPIVINLPRILRISVEDGKRDRLVDYNYILKLERIPFQISEYPKFEISLWNASTITSPHVISHTCESVDCSGENILLNLDGGNIRLEIERVETEFMWCVDGICEYVVSQMSFRIVYV